MKRRRENKAEEIFGIIRANNFKKLLTDHKSEIYEAQKIPENNYPQTPKKIKGRKKILEEQSTLSGKEQELELYQSSGCIHASKRVELNI